MVGRVSFGGGKHPAVSGHYRFRIAQVYRRATLSIIGKTSQREEVTPAETGLRRHCAPFGEYRGTLCAAQYWVSPTSDRNLAMVCDREPSLSPTRIARNVSTRAPGAGFLDRRRQFCSDCR